MHKFIISITISFMAFLNQGLACSSFSLKSSGKVFHAKNYDWDFGDGYLVYNPKNLAKKSLLLDTKLNPAQWISVFDSITFNQFGLELPNGGMNSAGLTVEILLLPETKYPADDGRKTLNELQWIQYILDTQNTVQGVEESFKQIRIQAISGNVHYLVCEQTGECLAVEYIKGQEKFERYHQKNKVLTNSTAEKSLNYLGKFKNFGGTKEVTGTSYNSLERFVRIQEALRIFSTQDIEQYSFQTLDSVKYDGYTQWQTVMNNTDIKFKFRTLFGNNNIANVELSGFKGDCSRRTFFDLNDQRRGDINKYFETLTFEKNYELVKKSILKIMPNMDEQSLRALAGGPFRFPCQKGTVYSYEHAF